MLAQVAGPFACLSLLRSPLLVRRHLR